MNQLAVSSIVLILLHSSINSVCGNGKITPVAVDNQSVGKQDLKSEEARFRDPMPEYYDRDRQGFVTSNYGGNMSPFERYGYNNNFDRVASNYYANRFPGGYDSREKYGNTPTITGNSFIDSKLNYLSGYGSKFPYGGGAGSAVYGPYGSPSYGGPGGMQGGIQAGGQGGLLPPELEAKAAVLLPLAGAALLGIAAYALVTGPGIAAAGPIIGKRRRRSVFDEAVEKHLAYKAYKKPASQKH